MKKTVKKLAAVALAAAFTCGALGALTACEPGKGPGGSTKDEGVISQLPDKMVYDYVFKDFYDAYAKADEAESVSERYALMALAEAKLLEINAFSFTYANGGNYAISRVAPHSVTNTAWGNDDDRLHGTIVATEFVKATDRAALNDAWSKMKEGVNPADDTDGHDYKGADYNAYAKQYMTDHGYTLKNEYRMAYGTENVSWDVLASSEQTDSEILVNTYDGLAEYDELGLLQPALATEWTSSVNPENGHETYTFTIRQGVKWVDSQGREVADLKADDFVAGFQHMLDAQGGLEYLVDGVVVGASEYIAGDETDFANVGCRAVDDYTLEYELESEVSYFTTMLCYGVFAPMNRAYFTSHGGAFGVEEFAEAQASDSYTYASDKDNIAYCGPYTITSYTEENSMVLDANATYWNKDNINIQKITRLYNDGSVTTKAYDDAKAGTIDGAALTSVTMANAKADGLFDDYKYVSSVDATAFMVAYNLNRSSYANWTDPTAVVSGKSYVEKERTKIAMLNQNFRRALTHAFDRVAYRTVQTGTAETAANPLVNSYTPGDYVSLEEEVTVEINGKATTFGAGVFYGEILQAQLDADEAGITAWKFVESKGEYSSTGFDGWYNVDLAKEHFAAAVEELAAQGLEISAAKPIEIDIVYPSFSEVYSGMQQSYKQSIESATNGFVKVNLVDAATNAQLSYATYYINYGKDCNNDVCVGWTGWGPDYGDPSTFLDTFLPNGAGYMTKLTGLF